jgi:hypothetical protein
MDYTGLVKTLALPADFVPPVALEYDGLVARALGRADLDADVDGINSSRDLIRSTRGGDWPTEPVTAEIDYVDLVWHELEFRERYSFSYAVYKADGGYVGCCYLYPVGRRTPLSEELRKHDVDVSWWVTPAAYEQGHYPRLYEGLRRWVVTDYPFTNPHFSNTIIPDNEPAPDARR